MNLIAKVGKFYKSLTEDQLSTSISVSPGSTIEVGEFFWIPDEDFIGYDSDAHHGHGLSDRPGPVDVGCVLKVRATNRSHAIVRLDRPKIPYGAPAAIGTVFQIPIAQISKWPEMIEATKRFEDQRSSLASEFCR